MGPHCINLQDLQHCVAYKRIVSCTNNILPCMIHTITKYQCPTCILIPCGPVTPYGDKEMGNDLSPAITWTKLTSYQWGFMPFIRGQFHGNCPWAWSVTFVRGLQLNPHLIWANELNDFYQHSTHVRHADCPIVYFGIVAGVPLWVCGRNLPLQQVTWSGVMSNRPVSQIRAPPGGLSRTSGKLWQDYSNCYMLWT